MVQAIHSILNYNYKESRSKKHRSNSGISMTSYSQSRGYYAELT